MELKLPALYTRKGSKIHYSKLGCGKQVGSKIYIHINYAQYVFYGAKRKILDTAINIALNGMTYKEFKSLTCVCYDYKKPNIVRFDTCPDFDTADCPTVGYMYYIDTANRTITERENKQIFHHKWLWVAYDYTGFNMVESWKYSDKWLSKFEEPASGYKEKFQEQLKKYGVI